MVGGMSVEESAPFYWLGYLGEKLRMIAEAHEGTEMGRDVRRVLREFESAPLNGRETVAFAVIDAREEVYAIRETRAEAERARSAAYDYLFGAASCGHPSAPGWVEQRLPFAVLTITEEERIEMLENGTPTLDREP